MSLIPAIPVLFTSLHDPQYFLLECTEFSLKNKEKVRDQVNNIIIICVKYNNTANSINDNKYYLKEIITEENQKNK